MKIQVISKLKEIESIHYEWERLFENSACNDLYLHPSWVYKWAENYSGHTLNIYLFYQRNRLVGVMPLVKVLRYKGIIPRYVFCSVKSEGMLRSGLVLAQKSGEVLNEFFNHHKKYAKTLCPF